MKDLQNLLISTKLNNKYFHNSIDWPVLFLQDYIPPKFGKMFRFTIFRLPETAFVNLLPSLWHDLILISTLEEPLS